MDEEGKDKHAENMVIEGMITKDEDVNPESSKTIEQQAIMDDTENIHINEVIIIFSHVIIIFIMAGQNMKFICAMISNIKLFTHLHNIISFIWIFISKQSMDEELILNMLWFSGKHGRGRQGQACGKYGY